MEKQLLFLEDIGVAQKEIEAQVRKNNIPFQIIRDTKNADKNAVEAIVTVKETVDKQMIDQYPHLKVIAVAFTGYDHVDLKACRNKNIAVYNVPAYATNSVVELTVGLTIGLLRQIPFAHNTVMNKKWNLNPGNDLSGKTVGIAGTGKIGIAAAKVFNVFGCNLLGWSRTQKEAFTELGGQYVSNLQELCAQSDIVSIHLPLNDQTKGMVGQKELSAMNDHAFLVNTARGPIVDESALFQVLKEQQIAGAGIDVFDQEPLPADHPFRRLDNVILTPHIAYKTEEALIRRAEVTFSNIRHFLDNNNKNRVD